jgi:hypothetical protein
VVNQRSIALVVVGAIVLFLIVAAVAAGLVIGGVVGAVAGRDGGLEVRTEEPASMEELRDSYRLDTGALEINLQDLSLPEGTTEVEADIENGALTVVVPKGVAVRAHSEVGNGALSILGSDASGENLDRDYESREYGNADRRLSLELSAGTGVVAVVRNK